MKPLTEFLPEVMPSVPGCPNPLAVNAVRNSVIEFVSRARLLLRSVDVVLTPGESRYSLDVDSGLTASTFLRGWLNETTRVHPVSPINEDAEHGDYWRKETGAPVKAYIDAGELIVAPIPKDAGTMQVDVLCTYLRNATAVDDFVLQDWIEPIAYGALARLLILPGPWSNPAAAVGYRRLFEMGASEAAIQTDKGGTMESLRVAPRRFA